MPAYRSLREHLQELDRRGLLRRIGIPVNKDTELHPLVRWQYRGGIPEQGTKQASQRVSSEGS